jgi:hypothetical protein
MRLIHVNWMDIGGRSHVDANRGVSHLVASVFGLQSLAAVDFSLTSCAATSDSQFELVLYAKIILFIAMYTMLIVIGIARYCITRQRLALRAQLLLHGGHDALLVDQPHKLVADIVVVPDENDNQHGIALLNRVSSSIPDIVPRIVSRLEMSCYFILDFMYFPIAAGVLHTLRCDDLRDIAPWPSAYFLRAAPYISCSDNDSFDTLRVASIVVLVILITHPLHVILRLWHVRPILASHPLRHSIGFLVSSSSSSHYWWNLVIVPGRRLLLALIVSQLPRGSVLIPLSTFALLLACVLLQVIPTIPFEYIVVVDTIIDLNRYLCDHMSVCVRISWK